MTFLSQFLARDSSLCGTGFDLTSDGNQAASMTMILRKRFQNIQRTGGLTKLTQSRKCEYAERRLFWELEQWDAPRLRGPLLRKIEIAGPLAAAWQGTQHAQVACLCAERVTYRARCWQPHISTVAQPMQEGSRRPTEACWILLLEAVGVTEIEHYCDMVFLHFRRRLMQSANGVDSGTESGTMPLDRTTKDH